ncbi:MAG TPA: carboxypeptidase regulatory-like domain-containing protein [Pyrinomonadaceae bacterium]|jgi:tetratricopeptide (TPR) repeat protein
MRNLRHRLSIAAVSERLAPTTVFQFVLIVLLLSVAPASAQTQREGGLRPIKLIVISGRVSLTNDRPAPRVRVRLSSSTGISRETLTSDSGRYEFTEVPPGSYNVAATSLTDSTLTSDSVRIDTNQSVTGIMNVNLSLADAAPRHTGGKEKTGVITLAEIEQKVPKDARKAFKRGLELKNDSQMAGALENFDRAITLYPEYFQALTERGDIYVSQRELVKAAADFDRALKANGRYEPALRGAGYCKLEGKEFAQAATYLEQAATADPANATTLLLLGISNLELDRREPARQALEQALKIDALRAIRAHIHLANLYAREHQYRRAADELHIYLESVPTDPGADELRKIEAQWRARPDK